MKSIVLITTGQPSVNPRIVKEADAFHNAGFKVTLLYCYYTDWATSADKLLLADRKWEYKMVGGSPVVSKPLYLFTRLRFKITNKLNTYLGNRFLLAERAQARCYDELLSCARSLKADWYIGHNLGALAISSRAASANKAKAGFDFEDYHRDEQEETPPVKKKRVLFLEEKYVPSLQYISSASPMISGKTESNFPGIKVHTILNSFPLSQVHGYRENLPADRELKLFWFSQTVGTYRGLETLIEALLKMNDPSVTLTLVGNCTDSFKTYLDEYAKEIRSRIHLAGTILPDELPAFAAKFDIGLALEPPATTNRDICLANKVFTYLLSGLAIIFSDTSMQSAFNNQYQLGKAFSIHDVEQLITIITFYKNREVLEKQRLHNYMLGQTELNWDKESEKLLSFFNQ